MSDREQRQKLLRWALGQQARKIESIIGYLLDSVPPNASDGVSGSRHLTRQIMASMRRQAVLDGVSDDVMAVVDGYADVIENAILCWINDYAGDIAADVLCDGISSIESKSGRIDEIDTIDGQDAAEEALKRIFSGASQWK